MAYAVQASAMRRCGNGWRVVSLSLSSLASDYHWRHA